MADREPAGLPELRGVLDSFQRDPDGGALVLQCHPSVARLLRTGAPDLVPAPATDPGSGAITRRAQVAIERDRPAGWWRLLEDGEVVTSGTVGVSGG